MTFIVPIDDARRMFPNYDIVAALTPSEQKAAFHVVDKAGEALCLKIISPNYDLGRLQREIVALQSLDHPNIVNLIEYTFTTKNNVNLHYIIEEFITGWDLSEVINKRELWDLEFTANFFTKLFDGLNLLNQHNIVHRDLKPNNIRVRKDFEPIIIDFGLARHLTLSDLTRTSDGAAIGTPLYFSPEQFSGTKHDIDHRTDLYAVGTLMYEAILGHHPFQSRIGSYDELFDAVCNSYEYSTYTEFITLPSRWKLLLDRLLQKERSRRPNSAGDVSTMLRKLKEEK